MHLFAPTNLFRQAKTETARHCVL